MYQFQYGTICKQISIVYLVITTATYFIFLQHRFVEEQIDENYAQGCEVFL